jgi:hypothetical protein
MPATKALVGLTLSVDSTIHEAHDEDKVAKEIVKAEIKFVSLCKRGKNRLSTLYKSDGSPIQAETLILKATPESMEKGELTALVYVPHKLDADKEWAGEAVVKAMAYSHAEHDFAIDMEHDGKSLSKADILVVESFLVQKGDPRFQDVTDLDGQKVDATGAWAQVYKLKNESLRALYKSGGWDGVSMGGVGARRPGEPLKKSKETPMTPDERAALVKEIVGEVTKALKPETKEKPPIQKSAGPKPPKDPTDLKAIREFRKAMEDKRIMDSVDWDDPESIAKHEAWLEERAEQAEADKASGQVTGVTKSEGGAADTTTIEGKITKGMEIGSKLAKHVNSQRGYATK